MFSGDLQDEPNDKLFRAVETGNLVSVNFLEPSNPTEKHKFYNTVLYLAALKGKINIVQDMLKKGADPNSKNENGSTPLHWAASKGYIDIVNKLLNAKADPNAQNKDDFTPLHLATSRKDNINVIKSLVKAGANVTEQDKSGDTPLHNAAFYGYADVVEYLVDNHAQLNIINAVSNTPLNDARLKQHYTIAQYLEESGKRPIVEIQKDEEEVSKRLVEQKAKRLVKQQEKSDIKNSKKTVEIALAIGGLLITGLGILGIANPKDLIKSSKELRLGLSISFAVLGLLVFAISVYRILDSIFKPIPTKQDSKTDTDLSPVANVQNLDKNNNSSPTLSILPLEYSHIISPSIPIPNAKVNVDEKNKSDNSSLASEESYITATSSPTLSEKANIAKKDKSDNSNLLSLENEENKPKSLSSSLNDVDITSPESPSMQK